MNTTTSPTELPATPGSAFERCRHTNNTVNHILRSGGSLEDVVVALCGQNDAMLKRLIEVESYAPKKIKADDGKVYVWHCPDDLIPMQNASDQ